MDNTIICKRMDENSKIFNETIEKIVEDAYKVGESLLIAYLLDSIHSKNFTLDDIAQYLYGLMDNDKEKKDFVYEQMKNIE